MATEIIVPALGESVTTATIARWIRQPGDTVAVDEPLVELETDKVTVEVSAPAAGVLTAINYPEGSEVEVGALLGVVDGDATARPAVTAPKAAASASATASAATTSPRQRPWPVWFENATVSSAHASTPRHCSGKTAAALPTWP